MSTTELIDRMNDHAETMLALRRARLGPHRHGWHCGKSNPYTVTSKQQTPRFADY